MRERLQVDRKVSQIQFILNAIEANAHRLAELVEQERPTAPTAGGLFPDQSTGRNAIEERTTINFDTTEANLKVIESLVEKHGADSRSQLLRAAPRAVLADRPTSVADADSVGRRWTAQKRQSMKPRHE